MNDRKNGRTRMCAIMGGLMWLCGMTATYAASTALPQTAEWQSDEEKQDSVDCEYLVVWHKDGTRVVFNLVDEPKVTWEKKNLKIESANLSAEYPIREMHKLTYQSALEDGIAQVSADGQPAFRRTGNTLTFMPAAGDLQVQVVTMGGVVMERFVVAKGKPTTWSLGKLEAGTYILSINGVGYKISVR